MPLLIPNMEGTLYDSDMKIYSSPPTNQTCGIPLTWTIPLRTSVFHSTLQGSKYEDMVWGVFTNFNLLLYGDRNSHFIATFDKPSSHFYFFFVCYLSIFCKSLIVYEAVNVSNASKF